MMIIRTSKDEDPYARISRALLQDNLLSYEARGLAAYLLSKPEDWEIEIHDLINQSPDGRDKTYRIIKELESNGYIKREQARTPRGKLGKTCYVLFESKTLAASGKAVCGTASGKTVYGKTVSGKSDTTYKRIYKQKNIQTKDITARSASQPKPKNKISNRDPRTDLPAIKAYHQVTGRYPQKALYDEVISLLGESPDMAHLNQCWVEASKRSLNHRKDIWLFDWYPNGIKEANRNGQKIVGHAAPKPGKYDHLG